MTTKEARKLLGDPAKDMTDDETNKIIDSLARTHIQSYLKGELELPPENI